MFWRFDKYEGLFSVIKRVGEIIVTFHFLFEINKLSKAIILHQHHAIYLNCFNGMIMIKNFQNMFSPYSKIH